MKKLVAIIMSLIGFGCIAEKPFVPVKLSEIGFYKRQKVAVEGVPTMVREDSFVISDGEKQVYIKRDDWDTGYGDYPTARSALAEEIDDKDDEKVKVYGIVADDSTIDARFLDVEGTLHEIYE
jgi:hypothetical protein